MTELAMSDFKKSLPQTVLLIDDDAAHLKSIGDIFEEEGLSPICCSNGSSALKACREHEIPVAVMDLKLPDGDGIVLMREMREINPDIKVIINTAYATLETAMVAVNDQAFAYVKKMGDVEELLAHVHRAFHLHLAEYSSSLKAELQMREEDFQRRLERVKRLESLSVLAGGVAHDLNNILGPIVAYPDLIMEMLEKDNPVCRFVETMRQSAERAAATVQDLLTLSRRGNYEMRPTDLNAVLKSYLSSADYIQRKETRPDITVTAELDKELLRIMGSPTHLFQMVMNLVINAFDATDGKGEIVITTTCEHLETPREVYDDLIQGDFVVLRIQDTGCGIRKEQLERIFEPFFTTKVMGRSGTGLGLAVTYGVLKDHEGYIDVSSVPNQGTTFSLFFPVTRQLDEHEADELTTISGSGRLLVVDDVPEQCELASDLLGALGYDVETVTSGEAAVQAVKDKHYDLVLLDMVLAENFDGLTTYEEILKVRPGQPCVIVSGQSKTARVFKAQELGAGEFLQKPFILKKLGKVIHEELAKRGSTPSQAPS
jgi:signal transduction histidine kinase